jgi:glycosyltransferase involved in cell wall biosynthesis
MNTGLLPGSAAASTQDLPQAAMHAELARRGVYVHPFRWTSLGLALLEAMHLGLPVVAVATTEVVEAVPPGAGVRSTRLDTLTAAVRRFLADPDLAAAAGRAAREAALARYGLARFLDDWDRLLKEVTR